MKIAFVGIKRKYLDLDVNYRSLFTKHHLELPWYYAYYGNNDVTIATVDYTSDVEHLNNGTLRCVTENNLSNEYDVVIHWRKWFPEFYKKNAINLLNCQDHSFDNEWKTNVSKAIESKQLHGILCFKTWHQRNLHNETGISYDKLLTDVTLGVDTEIFKPATEKNPFEMLWASDPGRGLNSLIPIAVKLWQYDKRFKLHVCYPDYVKHISKINHPALLWHANVNNGPFLWNLFNSVGILPYTSSFLEPSSRAHRQAQAAGSLVLYPNNMGTPSELIESGKTGIVGPIADWYKTIIEIAGTDAHIKIGNAARNYALSENWEIQATRFNNLIKNFGDVT